MKAPVAEWQPITFTDILTREEFEHMTLQMLYAGITNSDRMRDAITRRRKLILQRSTGQWNDTPSDKFVNEHAWVLSDLVQRRIVDEPVAEKEYRLISEETTQLTPERREGT